MTIIEKTVLIAPTSAGTGYKKELLAMKLSKTSMAAITGLVMARRRMEHRLHPIGDRSIQSRGVIVDT
jgi:hypothetical protein